MPGRQGGALLVGGLFGERARQLKDGLASKGLSAALGRYLQRYCHVFDLKIDSQNKLLMLTCQPLGEKEPITLTLYGYALETAPNGEAWLSFERFSASREWIERVAETALPEKRLKLPDGVPLNLLKTIV